MIPHTILRILRDLDVLIYGKGDQVRDWIRVLDHVKAIDTVIRKGHAGEIYNNSVTNFITNIDLVKRISSDRLKTGFHASNSLKIDQDTITDIH